MTRIAPAKSEPVEATPRRSMSPARRARILKRQDGICAYPECEAPAAEIDHIVCLELGGRDIDENTEGLCAPHHKRKTARDLKLIAKARRLRKSALGQKKRKGRALPSRPLNMLTGAGRKIPGRPFDRTKSKGFDGKVRARKRPFVRGAD